MSKASGACPLGECCSEHLSSDINKVPFFWLKTGLVLVELHGLGPQETMNEYKKYFGINMNAQQDLNSEEGVRPRRRRPGRAAPPRGCRPAAAAAAPTTPNNFPPPAPIILTHACACWRP